MIEKEEYTQDMIQQIICNVIGYSQHNGNILHKYNDDFYLSYFDRLKIDQTIKKVPAHQKELELSQFVRLFLSVIQHKTQETLYLTISLSKLYKKIKEQTTNQKGVKFSDFTSFLCNKISEGDPDLVIPMKEIPMQRVTPDISKVRDIDINPPPILNKVQLQHPKITKDKNKKDKKLQQKKPVAKFIYSQSLKSIITLGLLSSSITLYDPKDLHIKHKIIPSTCKIMSKDVAILSIAFCQRDQRIGCIINNIGVTFWEGSDNFSTQKILGANKSDYDPKGCGDRIYYLNLFQSWITTDHDTIYFWDLKQQKVIKSITKQRSNSINDICQINHIRCLLVSYNLQSQSNRQVKKLQSQSSSNKNQQKILILYQDGKQKSKLILQNPGCHSLCYNPSTQLVICLGYQSNVSIYQIDTKTLDINLITQLQAHTSILTCVSNIPDSSMIVSGDDIGYLKLWDLNYMRCLQSIKIAKGLTQMSCTGSLLIYADSRINTIPIDNSINGQNKILKMQNSQQSYGIYQFFRKQQQSLWIITRKQARQININTGRIKNILVICNLEQDISAAAQVYNGFLIGTSKGQMTKFTLDGQRKWKIMAHQGQIHTIRVDLQNHLIITIGGDNNLFIWAQKTITDQQGARKKISFQQTDINLLQVCPYANLLLISSTSDNKLSIWNYDSLKLAYILQFQTTITTFQILHDRNIIIVTTIDGNIQVFLYVRKQSKLKISLAFKININNVHLVNNKNHKNNRNNRDNSNNQTNQDQNERNMEISSDLQTYINKLSYCQDNNMILATTIKGTIYSFQAQNFLVNPNYRRQYQPTPILKRPMKQSLQNQLFKNQYINYKVKQMQQIQHKQHFKLQIIPLWSIKIHKDSINFLNVINLQKKYACTLCNDGYYKLLQLTQQQGKLVCSHKINFPLPVKWDIDVQNYCDLKNQIHQALAVIDSIIKNFSYQLTKKQQINLNITFFMQKMIQSMYQVKQRQKCAKIMSQQFTQADIKQIIQKQTSLKNLQAYKRLQLMKKHNQQNNLSVKPLYQPTSHYQTSAIEKQSIRNFLQPNYLPKLLNKNIPQGGEVKRTPGDLISRLDDIIAMRESKKIGDKDKEKEKDKDKDRQKDREKQKDKQNKIWQMSKSQFKIDENMIRKNQSFTSQKNSSFIQDKTVKQILSQINNKLHQHKKSKYRLQQSTVSSIYQQN